jgi:hypothetical protein
LPRIDDAVLDCAIYLYRSVDDAMQGEEIGGSGFLLSVPSIIPEDAAQGLSYAVCVTNRHVVELGATVVRLNQRERTGTCVADFNESHWVYHPHGADLAVTTIPVDEMGAHYRRISHTSLLTREMMAELNIGVGDDVFLVGRFVSHDGGQENSPTARFGNIAQMPGQPLRGECGTEQESYLIECRSIGGFSGSPVFVHIPPFSWRPDNTIHTHYFGPALLGVDWCHTFYPEPVMDSSGRELDSYVQSHSGLMGVVPSWKLAELIECEAFVRRVSTTMGVNVYRRV